LLAWALITAGLASFGGLGAAQAATSNVVPDASFRKCLNDAMYGAAKDWPITIGELVSYAGETLYSRDEPEYQGLSCDDWTHGVIKSVEGAQYLTGISGIDFLGSNAISDLRPLAALPGLRELDLEQNRHTPFSQLALLTPLRKLDLAGTGISDLAPLAKLTGLIVLDLSANNVRNLTPLRGLTNVTSLYLANWPNCRGVEVACYRSNGKPQWSWRGHNALSDLAPLSTLTRLTRLDLRATKVSSVGSLSGLTNLTFLNLSSNQISDISPLGNLSKLAILWVNGNRLASVATLSRLGSLTELNLSVNRLTNLSAVPVVSDWNDGGCDHDVQEPDWGCIEAAVGQVGQVVVAAPGTYDYPVVGRAGLTGTIFLKAKSGAASVGSGRVTYSRPGTAVLTFEDYSDDQGTTFTGKVTVHVLPATVTLSGTARFGKVLRVPGVPSDLPGVCQWLRNGAAIAGATGCSHTVTAADVGQSVAARITVTNGAAAGTKLTTAVTPVAADFGKVGRPAISGSARVGSTLTARTGTWSPKPDSFGFQWYRDGVAIPSATAATYTPTATDLATAITVSVTGAKAGYNARTRSSRPARIHPGVLVRGKVGVSGTLEFGSTLTADAGTWTPAPVTLGYTWLRGGRVIAGATAAKYNLVAADIGKRIAVRVTGSKPGYQPAARTATTASTIKPRTLTVPPEPAISGTPLLGSVVTVDTGGWAPQPVALTCQWFRSGTAIPGAATCAYTLAAADQGKRVTARVTGAKEGYRTVALASASTVRIGAVTAGRVVISGTAKVGTTLTAVRSGWGPAGVGFSYQWRRNGVPIGVPGGSQYVPTTADRGKRISVTVTGTKPDYAAAVVTSGRTGKIAS
jgi:hypothetical protein